MKADVKNT